MVKSARPVIALVNEPVVPLSVVLEPAVVGPVVVLQQTPLAVTVAPPSDVTLPPLAAVAFVIVLAAVVAASTGTDANAAPPIIFVQIVPLNT